MNINTNYIQKSQELTKFVKKQSENQRFLRSLETSATFFLITIFGLFAIRPTFSTISELIGDINSKEIMVNQMRDRIKSVVKAQENYALAQEKYYIIESSLPDGYRFYNSSSQFQAAFQEYQIAPKQISYGFQQVGQKDKEGNYDTYSVRTGTDSEFSSIISFIRKILNVRRLMDINQVNFSLVKDSLPTADADTPPSADVSFDISTDVYYWKTGNE